MQITMTSLFSVNKRSNNEIHTNKKYADIVFKKNIQKPFNIGTARRVATRDGRTCGDVSDQSGM